MKRSLEGNYASFKNIKFSRGNYQTDSSETLTLYCLYCSPLNFLQLASSNIILNYLISTFLDGSRDRQMYNLKKKTDKKPLNAISIVYFLQARLFQEEISRTTTIHTGIFRGWTLFKQ